MSDSNSEVISIRHQIKQEKQQLLDMEMPENLIDIYLKSKYGEHYKNEEGLVNFYEESELVRTEMLKHGFQPLNIISNNIIENGETQTTQATETETETETNTEN